MRLGLLGLYVLLGSCGLGSPAPSCPSLAGTLLCSGYNIALGALRCCQLSNFFNRYVTRRRLARSTDHDDQTGLQSEFCVEQPALLTVRVNHPTVTKKQVHCTADLCLFRALDVRTPS